MTGLLAGEDSIAMPTPKPIQEKQFKFDIDEDPIETPKPKDVGFFSGLKKTVTSKFKKEDDKNKGKIMPQGGFGNDVELMQLLDLPENILQDRQKIYQLQTSIDRLESSADELTKLFYDEVNSRSVEIENLEDEDIEMHQELYEVQELKQLENQIKQVEEKRLEMIRQERAAEAELMVETGRIVFDIDALENKNEYKNKERERALTKLYQTMNSKFKNAILHDDGQMQIKQRKIKKFIEPHRKQAMLFDGIRDQKIKVKW